MSRFITLLLVCAAILACIGYSRGWFSVSVKNNGLQDKTDVSLQIDRQKVIDDAELLRQKAKKATE